MPLDNRIPFLIWTDAPDKRTGLARICRDLCYHIINDTDTNAKFRVGTYGFFGKGSARLPWMQYVSNTVEEGIKSLPDAWKDFAYETEQAGVLFTITPPTWIFSITCPDFAMRSRPEEEQWMWSWYLNRPYKTWAYLAIESCTVNHEGKQVFSRPLITMMNRLDRPLFYSHWGASIASQCLDIPRLKYLTHGIHTDVFFPSYGALRAKDRMDMGLNDKDILVGCVATNTRRKNLGLLIQAYALMKNTLKADKVKLWLHTDVYRREWDLMGLLGDFNLLTPEEVIITSTNAERSDEWLARMYSACDVFTLPTDGEGYGYPVVESLACGTPVVTGDFGAQSQFLESFMPNWLVNNVNLSLHGSNNLLIPSYKATDWANKLIEVTAERRFNPSLSKSCKDHAAQWDWKNVWPHWHDWLLDEPTSTPAETPILTDTEKTS